ncbi:uncharacterized protein K452DRAFT_106648 [Aplosporella prunicola CBS 121167]|uniref:Uncharacterized protein n=1 Tax=Aplosporella prunicola CBS 121167 TaxID=1176127 RepID=A0A6A6BQW1_9PEZI|nr:uncharacterized protein K452DRAFT_106648 [Aplosporella prunicola CBS 121167]KAF2146148.1 hypothetical protein K452DRAFT_106648 [Aplosporella prunicola CBS 121167]
MVGQVERFRSASCCSIIVLTMHTQLSLHITTILVFKLLCRASSVSSRIHSKSARLHATSLRDTSIINPPARSHCPPSGRKAARPPRNVQ